METGSTAYYSLRMGINEHVNEPLVELGHPGARELNSLNSESDLQNSGSRGPDRARGLAGGRTVPGGTRSTQASYSS